MIASCGATIASNVAECAVISSLAPRPEDGSYGTQKPRQLAFTLESRVRAALGNAFATPITIKVVKGKVTLTGTTMSPIGNVEELVRAIPGVTEVENRIVVIRSGAA